jgi:hypothetical protein
VPTRSSPRATYSSRQKTPSGASRIGPPHRDEVPAFIWGLERAGPEWDVAAKVDADVCLSVSLFAEMEQRFFAEPRLGMIGAHFSQVGPAGVLCRRRLDRISPIPAMIGRDTVEATGTRAYAYGSDPVYVLVGAAVRLRAPPPAGHSAVPLVRAPRAEPGARAHQRRAASAQHGLEALG